MITKPYILFSSIDVNGLCLSFPTSQLEQLAECESGVVEAGGRRHQCSEILLYPNYYICLLLMLKIFYTETTYCSIVCGHYGENGHGDTQCLKPPVLIVVVFFHTQFL